MRATSSAIAVRGMRPASSDQVTLRASPFAVQVPQTTPPAMTTFALRVTGSRREVGVTDTSFVPGAITHWSWPGRKRTAFDGFVAISSSRSSCMT